MKRHLLWSAAVVAVILTIVAGCVREERPESPGFGEFRSTDTQFERIKNARVTFEPVGRLSFDAGKPARLSFALKNVGGRPLRIPEWRMNEVDNIRLFCQPWLPDMTKPDENAWMAMNDEVKKPELRYTLELMPSNQAIVTRDLTFVEDLVVSTGAERRYFVKAELNLTSLPMSTGVFAIAVVGR